MEETQETYAVWVGSLDDKIEEKDIFAEFKQYGPICNVRIIRDKKGNSRGFAFVNFYSKEVAEVAANDMNGTSILGVEIKTSFKDESHKKKDLRAVTDCSHFLEGKPCSTKKCFFRHSKKARSQLKICDGWLQKKCLDEDCPKRHPAKKDLDGEGKAKKKIQITRCNSHNEFKCVGQCQNPDCNHDHYFSENALREHIMNPFPLEKKAISFLCEECGVSFDSYEEKQKHSHNDDDDDDDDDNDDGDDGEDVDLGAVYIRKQVETKKVCKSEKDTHTISDKLEPIGIYWDIENCPVPNGKSTRAVVQRIRDVFLPGRSEVEFVCVCDTLRERESVDQLNKAEVNVVHVDAVAKNAADDKLKKLMLKFSKHTRCPSCVLLISGDVNFSPILNDLKHTSNFHIILLHNGNASENLLQFAHEKRRFDHFTADLPLDKRNQTPVQVRPKPQSVVAAEKPSLVRTPELLISNLPFGVEPGLVTTRLSILSDNCGGKVQPLVCSAVDRRLSCVIRFPSADKADRALVRLDGQDVCGAKIRVTPYWGEINIINSPVPHLPLPIGNPIPQPSVINKSPRFKNDKPEKKPVVRTNLSKTMSLGALNSKMGGLNFKDPKRSATISGNLPLNSSWTGPIFTDPYMMQNQIGLVPGSSQPVQKQGKKSAGPHIAQKPTGLAAPKLSQPVQKQTLGGKIMEPLMMQKLMASPVPPQTQKRSNTLLEKVSGVLKDDSDWLPLSVFLAKYKAVHNENFNIFDLSQLKGQVLMDGERGRKFIYLLSAETRNKNIDVHQNFFSKNLMEIVKEHRRKLPLSGIPGMFWSYKKVDLKFNVGQNTLYDLVKRCPFANVIDNGLLGLAVCFKPQARGGLRLQDFANDFELLLMNSPKFQIPLNQWTNWYRNFFGTTLDPLSYGFSRADVLLSKIPEIAKVHKKVITFTPVFLTQVMKRQIEEILKTKKNKQLFVSLLPVEYYKFYGWKLGLDTKKLVRSLKGSLTVFKGNNKQEIIKLKQASVSPFELFKKDLIALLRSKPNGQLPIEKLTDEFYAFHGKSTKLAELGFDHPNDLFKALESHVQVIANGDSNLLQLVSMNPVANIGWNGILEILKNKTMFMVNDIQNIDERRKLLMSVPPTVKVIGSGRSQCFMLKSKIKSLTDIDINSEIDSYLYGKPDFTMLVSQLLSRLKNAEYTKYTDGQLLLAIRNYIRKHDQQLAKTMTVGTQITVSQEKALELFCEEAVDLLTDQEDHCISVHKFCGEYHKMFGTQYKLANFGFKKAVDLFKALPGNMIEVETINGQSIIKLTKLAKFLKEATTLLYQHDGAILQNQFLDFHRKKYEPCNPTDLGFANFTELLKSFPDKFMLHPAGKSLPVVFSKDHLLYLSAYGQFESDPDASDSDDETVIVESEDFQPCKDLPDLEDGQTDTDEKDSLSESDIDLIDISDAETDSASATDPEWWISDIPDLLPSPEIEPERVVNINQPFTDDLINIDDTGNDQATAISDTRNPSNRMKGRAKSLFEICNQNILYTNGTNNAMEDLHVPSEQASPQKKDMIPGEPEQAKKKGRKIAANFDFA